MLSGITDFEIVAPHALLSFLEDNCVNWKWSFFSCVWWDHLLLKWLPHHVNQTFLFFCNAFYGAVRNFLLKHPFQSKLHSIGRKSVTCNTTLFPSWSFGSKKVCNLSLLLLKPLSTSGIKFFGEAPLLPLPLPKKTLNFLECLTLPHQRLNICGHDLLGPSYELQGSSNQFDVFQENNLLIIEHFGNYSLLMDTNYFPSQHISIKCLSLMKNHFLIRVKRDPVYLSGPSTN